MNDHEPTLTTYGRTTDYSGDPLSEAEIAAQPPKPTRAVRTALGLTHSMMRSGELPVPGDRYDEIMQAAYAELATLDRAGRSDAGFANIAASNGWLKHAESCDWAEHGDECSCGLLAALASGEASPDPAQQWLVHDDGESISVERVTDPLGSSPSAERADPAPRPEDGLRAVMENVLPQYMSLRDVQPAIAAVLADLESGS